MSRSSNPRIASAAGTIAVHLALVGLLFLPSRAPIAHPDNVLSVFNVSAISDNPKPNPPKSSPATLVPPPAVLLPVVSTSVSVTLEEEASTSAAGACDLTAPVQAALQASEEVRTSLPRIPRDQRSVANAIMVWKTAWLAEDQDLDASAVAVIRDVVAGTVAAASPECRVQPQTGPRLLLLPGPSETVVLAVGSGVWRWQDVLDTAVAERNISPRETIQASASLSRMVGASFTMR